ncbi:kelch domain-containing protein 4-like [Ptychodera flava]|uniref:kelch domain-containing protein 4-like n=1 Tax=Ptychodera flava TaxID=63121 RepID=UPI00396A0302
MGKKNKKKDKKGYGAEKTAAKTAKKAEKRARKELQLGADEDLDALIAEFTELDRKRAEVSEQQCDPPSPRCSMSLTAHPDKDELIMFGGEYFNGQKTFVYNDLYIYNIKRNEWTLVKAPNAPPPRCAHQAVALSQGGGQLWIFGGEFSSPTLSQFHHYKDLWVYHLSEKKWEKISSPGAPTSRSGHRMVVYKRLLVIFGGFHESLREYRYFNDVHAFNLDTYQWIKLSISGNGPSPRSACQFLTRTDGALLVYGGYTKKPVKKDVDQGVTHDDMFLLSPQKETSDEAAAETMPTKWKWSRQSQSGMKPLPRSGTSMVVTAGNRAFMFGGVNDLEDDDEDLESEFLEDMYTLDLERGKWFELQLRGKKQKKKRRRKQKEKDSEKQDNENDEGSGSESDEEVEEETKAAATVTEVPEDAGPCARMNCLMTVKRGILYLYGGVYERGDVEITLNDMYAIDVHKFDEWKTLVALDKAKQEWKGEVSSDEDDDEEEEEDDDEGDDEIEGAVGGTTEESILGS